jgi:two-component system, sensor histidine kinase and response regulator
MKQILVIDDENAYRQTMSNMLRQSGYSVLEAQSGEEGIEIAQNQPVDVIVSDVIMGNLDGFGVLDRLRMDSGTSTIPFVFMTGLSDKESMRKGMTRGADDFLVKPFTGNELVTAIEARLAKRKEMVDESDRKLSQLRSSISLALPHELNTPLSSILGFAEIIGDENSGLSAAETAHFGKLIHQAGKRLQRLLENFIVYARIELLGSEPEMMKMLRQSQIFNAAEILKALSQDKASSYRRDPDLTFDLCDSPIAIAPGYFSKIIEELIDNAFKFSPSGTEVRVTTSSNGHTFSLVVTDRGRGMTTQQVQSMGAYVQFERRFYEQQGAGLGLIIAKKLVEIHGGTMEFAATPGGGLTVRACLPVSVLS